LPPPAPPPPLGRTPITGQGGPAPRQHARPHNPTAAREFGTPSDTGPEHRHRIPSLRQHHVKCTGASRNRIRHLDHRPGRPRVLNREQSTVYVIGVSPCTEVPSLWNQCCRRVPPDAFEWVGHIQVDRWSVHVAARLVSQTRDGNRVRRDENLD